MAKSDIAKNGQIFLRSDKYRKYACDITMTQIESATRKRTPMQLGIRSIIIDAYKTHGYMGAMISLKTYNDRIKRKFPDKDKRNLPLYSIEQIKEWILEYEETNKGATHDGDAR